MPYVACGYEKCNAACRSHYGLHHKVLTKNSTMPDKTPDVLFQSVQHHVVYAFKCHAVGIFLFGTFGL